MTRNRFFRREGACHKTIPALCVLLASFPATSALSDSNNTPSSEKSPFLSTQVANFSRVAHFSQEESTTTEQNGHIVLKVAFSHAFSGGFDLSNLSIDGTAKQGTDFDPPELTVATNGSVREIDIIINLRDDEEVEDVETIRVTLLPGKGYQLESPQQHTISIQDNDAAWRVVHDVDGMNFDYGMQIIRNGGSTATTVTSDGGNGLPAGTYPVNLHSADDNRFEAIVGPVTVAADRTLLGAKIDRTFTLIADPSKDNGHKVDYEHLLIGTATETWTSESASHLTRGDPISGTFVMSRTIGGVTSEKPMKSEAKESTRTTTSVSGGPGAESECEVADMSGTSNYAVIPGKSRSQVLGNPEMARAGQPFVAAHTPYPNFVTETLDQARAALYYDKAPTQEAKNLAAFRYRTLLYEKEVVDARTYILAQFDKIDDLWSCAERKRAHQTAQTVIDALRYAPWNRELRWALLDIYYDIAVADKALAQEKHVAVAELMTKPASENRDEFIIDKEIAILEDALPLYRNALAGYMKVIRGTFGVDVADFEADPALHDEPFGYLIFRQEVPWRSPSAALLKNDGGDWVLPQDADIGDQRLTLFQGYKDVTLLFELLREYLRTAEQLSKRYMMRGKPSDFDQAEKLIGDILINTWLEGNALLAMFPEILEKGESNPIDSKSGLREAVAGYRHSYSALGHLRSMLSGGGANILGLPDDDYLPIVSQSVIPGDSGKEYFHSYDYLEDLLKGLLESAKTDLAEVYKFYNNYRDRQDQLAQQFADRNEQYDERLRQIVGVKPGELGYNDPSRNYGGEINQQHTHIEAAAKFIELNSKRIENLIDEIHIEIEKWEKRKEINNAKQKLLYEYGGKQASLSVRIAEINAIQAENSNIVSGFLTLAGTIGLAVATGGTAAPFIAFGGLQGFLLQADNASFQASMEANKGELQASKERLAAAERAELASLEGVLLDVDIKTRIQKLLLRMSEIVIESEEAALRCQSEMQRLSALYLEKEALERRKAESNEGLADRYFADPSHRLLSHAALLRSQSSFASAQRWMFMAIRAAEYKWNEPFEHTTDAGVTFTKRSLFRTRNIRELEALSQALDKWDKRERNWAKGGSDETHYKLSIRDHIGFKAEFKNQDNQRCDPKKESCVPRNDQSMPVLEEFQRFIAHPNNYIKPEDTGLPIDPRFTKILRLNFGTAYGEDDLLLLHSRWNEKVKYLKIELQGAERKRGGQNSILPGYLTYGGISRIRNRLSRSTTTEYPIRSWSYDGNRWTSEEVIGSAVPIQLWHDPDVPKEEYMIKTFNELSTATTDWTLYIPVEVKGESLVDVSKITDIVFHIGFYFYTG